jgi:hypothetical protein
MKTFTKATERGDFIPFPEGTAMATLIGLYFLGPHPTVWNGQERQRRLCALHWEASERAADGRALSVLEVVTESLDERAKLYQRILSLNGGLEPEPGLDLRLLLGRPAVITVRHVDKDGRVFANVTQVGPVPRGLVLQAPSVPLQFFDIEDLAHSCDLATLPKRCQKWALAAVDSPFTRTDTPLAGGDEPRPRQGAAVLSLVGRPDPPATTDTISPQQAQRLVTQITARGLPPSRVMAWLAKAWSVRDLHQLPVARYPQLLQKLDQWAADDEAHQERAAIQAEACA